MAANDVICLIFWAQPHRPYAYRLALTRQRPQNPQKGCLLMKPGSEKHRMYQIVYALNRAFAFVVLNFERLEELGAFRRKYLRAFKIMAQELQAGANHEIAETLRDQEEKEWAHYGRLVRAWEKRFEDPHDVILEAKPLTQRSRTARRARSRKRPG